MTEVNKEIRIVRVVSTGETFFYKEFGDAILIARLLAAYGNFVEIL